jgi:hypothetical protein
MVGSKTRTAETDSTCRAAQPHTLGYLCDLIHELTHLANRSGQRTLSAILAAALTEAHIQNEHTRR